MLVCFSVMLEKLRIPALCLLVMHRSLRTGRKELFVMLEPSGAVGECAHVSHRRLGFAHPEGLAFQLGIPVLQDAPPVVREPIRVMAGR